MSEVADFWTRYESEHFKSERISPGNRSLAHSTDLIAMMILDRHFPSRYDMVSAAGHEKFYLKVDPNELFSKDIPEEDILDLMRCGLFHDSRNDSFYFFT